MNTRIAQKLIWWVLPLLALRGLVPAGFMIDTSQGDVSIIVCPGHAPHSDAAGTADSQGDRHSSNGQGAVCPFAVAAAAGPLSSVATFSSTAALPTDFIVDDIAGPKLPFGPSRAQQSRAPPVFS